ncbi:Spore protein SP21 [Defluviimonas aquaemixtae]|uniref:Spore protein SP21 n=1 Tax=Albidovulum aquaemixtae TaxID=1542388 RepID=A0A2R8B8M9_9RHOB|nr:Hsp20/alpha crystallin family protein [Defluviimonas aquaemixtae]SPH18803.1 Spore protein SP21 [Defluviimonas aquaemixtae]
MRQNRLPSRTESSTTTPFFRSLHDEIDRVFDRFSSGLPMSARDLWGRAEDAVMPALDVAETEKEVVITAEVPGVAEQDLDVSITDDVLTIKGEKSSDHEEREENYHLVERRYGRFSRSVSLGFAPDDGKVQASFRDGVLTLKIAKPEGAVTKTRKVSIGKG